MARITHPRIVAWVLAAATIAPTMACAPRTVAPAASPTTTVVWPEPPQPARIKFVQVLSDSQSMAPPKRGVKQSIVDYLSGKQPPSDHLYQPMDIAASEDGQRVYIADFGQMSVFVVDYAAKRLSTLPVVFERPFGVALDRDGLIYVSEQDAKRITVLDPSGQRLRAITHPSLVRPAGIEIDKARGLLYVADPATQASKDHSVKVFDLAGNLLRTVGTQRGSCEGCLLFPTFVALDSRGRLYVSNTMNGRIDIFDAEGTYVRRVGERGTSYGMFDKPKGIALDTFDNLYVVDSGWSNVQIFNPAGDVLLFFGGRGANPGLLANPTGIAIDKQNRIYVADFLNYRVATYQLVNTTADDARGPDKAPSRAPVTPGSTPR
jgi:DNA-binding beta-propeller fold protein YncE